MWQGVKQGVFVALFSAVLLFSVTTTTNAQVSLTTKTGALADGATYLIQVPSNWNGTLFLYSHGYVVPGSANPAQNVGDPATGAFLLANGFALAGSSYAHTGWAIQEALVDQIQVLDLFDADFGKPKQTIAWGHSLGGIITAGLVQNNPGRFTAAQPMCGVLAGGVATWNAALDAEFAFKTLLAPNSDLQLVNITNPNEFEARRRNSCRGTGHASGAGANRAVRLLSAILPAGLLRFHPSQRGMISLRRNKTSFCGISKLIFRSCLRFELNSNSAPAETFRGTPALITAFNYCYRLTANEVWALYQTAGLSLFEDIETLNRAARIKANPSAVQYLEQNIIFDGEIHIPVLTMHTTGDGLVINENESAYRTIVDLTGNHRFLRQTFVSRAGHCTFTPAETIAAVGTLLNRVETGHWSAVDANTLNGDATALGPNFNIFPAGNTIVPTPPAFVEFLSGPYPRPFDSLAALCPKGANHGCPFAFFLQH